MHVNLALIEQDSGRHEEALIEFRRYLAQAKGPPSRVRRWADVLAALLGRGEVRTAPTSDSAL